jgi:RNA polymerase subunit RPABC4/transcription elongation factor Spt4
MSIRNCPECGRIFEFVFKNLCPECIQREDKESEAVVDYLKDNPGARIPEISEATGISADKITKMLKNGRLISICERNGIKLLACEHCGKPIANGNLCQQCSDSMTMVLHQGARKLSNNPTERPNGARLRKESDKKNLFTTHFNR